MSDIKDLPKWEPGSLAYLVERYGDTELGELAEIVTSKDAAIAALKAENERLKEDYERACKTVADMHAAAVGEIMGPKRGVVEDVADIRTELEQLRKVVGCMGRGWDYWFISDSDAKANNLDIAGMKEGMGK